MNLTTVDIYTDGSCHTNFCIGAWAALFFINNQKIIIKGEATETTHNRMELMAVINAIGFIDKKWTDTTLVIYTDSQYVCRIRERKDKLKARNFITNKGIPIQNCDLVKTLIDQIETHKINFVKIKAHQKIENTSNNLHYQHNREVDQIVRNIVRESVKRLL